MKHGDYLEGFLVAPKGQITFFVLTIIDCHRLKGLEIPTPSTLINNRHSGF